MSSYFNIILKDTLKPTGGPSGYLYNLNMSLETNTIKNISLLSYGIEVKSNSSKKNPLKTFIKSLKVKFLPVFLRKKYLRKKEEREYINFYSSIINKLQNSALNNFHHTKDFYFFKKLYPENRTLTLLMSHAPEPPHVELYQAYLADGYTSKKALHLSQHQKEIDISAFKSADYIIFPCHEAVAPYEPFFKENNIDTTKLRFVITSSEPLNYILSANQFKIQNNIDQSKISLAYVGRKTKIKGYDIFCDAAKTLEGDSRFTFIAAGNGAIETPNLKNLLDFGWTNDPGSILNAVDYLIIPNRDTYFDLGIIQALSLNKTLITTPTGGNRWFLNKNLDIIFFEPDVDSLVKIIKQLKKSTDNKNELFFKKYLSNEHFAINYLKLFQNIEQEQKLDVTN